MESSILNVRVNADDKKQFEVFCDEVGMNVSTAVNMFIKAVLRDQKLPFEIRSEAYDKLIYEKLKEAELEMEKNSKRYTVDELSKEIDCLINSK